MPYQTVGNLRLVFPGHENYTGYYRELDIDKALVSSKYTLNGTKFETTLFSSAPDQVIVYKVASDKPGSVALQELQNHCYKAIQAKSPYYRLYHRAGKMDQLPD